MTAWKKTPPLIWFAATRLPNPPVSVAASVVRQLVVAVFVPGEGGGEVVNEMPEKSRPCRTGPENVPPLMVLPTSPSPVRTSRA